MQESTATKKSLWLTIKAEEVVNQENRPREIDPAITEAVDRWKANEYFHRTFRQMTGMTPANFQ